MAEPTTDNDTENTDDPLEGLSISVVPVGARAQGPAPTLDAAFTMLCQALSAHFEDDLPAQLHCDEIQGWYANQNHGMAWAHAVALLEQVVNVKLGT